MPILHHIQATGGTSAADVSTEAPVNFEANPELAEMLAHAPYAIPLPGKIMLEKGLRVSDVPAGLLLSEFLSEIDGHSVEPATPKTDLPSRRRSGSMESISKSSVRLKSKL